MLNRSFNTSTDTVNWTDHGTVASRDFPMGSSEQRCVGATGTRSENGKLYHVPISVPGWPKNVIAVAVADSPFGPFKDVLSGTH